MFLLNKFYKNFKNLLILIKKLLTFIIKNLLKFLYLIKKNLFFSIVI